MTTIQELLETLINDLNDLEWQNSARALLPDDAVTDALDLLGVLRAELN